MIVKLVSIGELQDDGNRIVYFELNGQPREIKIRDASAKVTVQQKRKADATNPGHIGASMPGKVLKIMVKAGDKVKKGEHLIVTEAMKMETTMQAPYDAEIQEVAVQTGDSIDTADLLIVLE